MCLRANTRISPHSNHQNTCWHALCHKTKVAWNADQDLLEVDYPKELHSPTLNLE